MQLPLLTDTHIARRSDPVTSHKAAAKVKASGQCAVQQAIAFAYVREYPDHTAQELADICLRAGGSMDRYDFGRRLPEIAKDHDKHGNRKSPLIKKRCHPDGSPMKRVCAVTGNEACTWVPADWVEP